MMIVIVTVIAVMNSFRTFDVVDDKEDDKSERSINKVVCHNLKHVASRVDQVNESSDIKL